MFRNALISVSNKEGLIEFVKPLWEKGMRIVSTGGTSKYLRDHGLSVTEVAEQTGFPEVMDGRVRTLHPYIHMPLLARNTHDEDLRLLKEQGLEPFDLVIGSLYPFEQVQQSNPNIGFEDLIEYIDVGGPTLLRAAAKNFERIAVVCDQSDYRWITNKAELTLADRKKLAAKVFALTSRYDLAIAQTLATDNSISLQGDFHSELRYGENPHQSAKWYRWSNVESGWQQARVLQGKPLSYNNLLDLDAGRNLAREFATPCAVGIKHTNPCGVGLAKSLGEAVSKMLKADPTSIFGGIVVASSPIDGACAELLSGIFLECIAAPDYTPEALACFSRKKNLRILKWPGICSPIGSEERSLSLRSIAGGLLVQDQDVVGDWSEGWEIKGQKPPLNIKNDLVMAWRVCGHLKSNAIAIVLGGQTVGLGMGQVNRIDAVKQAIERARLYHTHLPPNELVLASDAFFPFADSIEMLADAGIHWVIQPGGSVRDEEVFSAAARRGVNLIVTASRHFRH